jgi:hypothetical protein
VNGKEDEEIASEKISFGPTFPVTERWCQPWMSPDWRAGWYFIVRKQSRLNRASSQF